MTQSEPWYIHAGLYTVIVVLIIVLVKVAIIDPKEVVQQEKYNRKESRLRMTNLKESQILYQKKYGRFTDNLDSLIYFVKNDPMVDSIKSAIDPLSKRPSNPFVALSHGEFAPESLFTTPKSSQRYIMQIDSTVQVDTVINPRGRVIRIDTTLVIGGRYYIEDPDGYGAVGSLDSDARKNTPSWE